MTLPDEIWLGSQMLIYGGRVCVLTGLSNPPSLCSFYGGGVCVCVNRPFESAELVYSSVGIVVCFVCESAVRKECIVSSSWLS